MNINETHALVIKASTIDNRVVSPLTVESWHEILHTIDAGDALEALRAHRTEHPDVYVQPGHIYQGARRIRDRRLRAAQQAEQLQLERSAQAAPKPDDFDDIVAEVRAETRRAQVANTSQVLAALRAKPAPAERPDAERRRAAARAELDALRTGADL